VATKTAITVSAAAAITRRNNPSVNRPSDDPSTCQAGIAAPRSKLPLWGVPDHFVTGPPLRVIFCTIPIAKPCNSLPRRVADAGSIVLTVGKGPGEEVDQWPLPSPHRSGSDTPVRRLCR